MKKIMILCSVILYLLVPVLYAQSFVDELKSSSGSHATAMTVSTQTKDALSIFTNPGLLGTYNDINFDVVRIKLLNEAASYSAGLVVPVEPGFSFGFAFNKLSNQNIMANQAFAGMFDKMHFSETIFLFSFGKNIWNGLNVGFGMKAIQQTISNKVSNFVHGADVGLVYHIESTGILDRTVVSASIENYSKPELEFGIEKLTLPRFYRLGLEKTLAIPGGTMAILTNIHYSEKINPRFRVGFEYNVPGIGTAAFGWDEKQQLSIGGKLKISDFRISAAHIYTNYEGFYSISIGYSLKPGWF